MKETHLKSTLKSTGNLVLNVRSEKKKKAGKILLEKYRVQESLVKSDHLSEVKRTQKSWRPHKKK